MLYRLWSPLHCKNNLSHLAQITAVPEYNSTELLAWTYIPYLTLYIQPKGSFFVENVAFVLFFQTSVVSLLPYVLTLLKPPTLVQAPGSRYDDYSCKKKLT